MRVFSFYQGSNQITLANDGKADPSATAFRLDHFRDDLSYRLVFLKGIKALLFLLFGCQQSHMALQIIGPMGLPGAAALLAEGLPDMGKDFACACGAVIRQFTRH